jgi:hypothetical protein
VHTWDFDDPESMSGLEVTRGIVVHEPARGVGGSGCIYLQGVRNKVVLDTEVRLPVLITARWKDIPNRDWPESTKKAFASAGDDLVDDGYMLAAGWQDYDELALFRGLREPDPFRRGWQSFSAHFTDAFHCADPGRKGVPVGITVCRRKKGARLALYVRLPQLVDNLTIREISEDEVPDLSAYLDALLTIPAEKREGTVELPQFEVRRADGPVRVLFGYADTRHMQHPGWHWDPRRCRVETDVPPPER